MSRRALTPPSSDLAIMAPPYLHLSEIEMDWQPDTMPPRGRALLWWVRESARQQHQFLWLRERPYGLPLFVFLPDPDELEPAMPLLNRLRELEPRSVLPVSMVRSTDPLRAVLATVPPSLSDSVASYFVRRGIVRDSKILVEVQKILAVAGHTRSVSRVAATLQQSRRTLGRHFAAAGLPVPSHWLQFARLLHAALRLQNEPSATVARTAARLGYPDGFTMSNQMKRLMEIRPSEARDHLGWEWLVESWIATETRTGGFDRVRYSQETADYVSESPSQGEEDDVMVER